MIALKYGKRKVINYRGARIVVGGLTARNKIDILLYISKELGMSNEERALYDQVLRLAQEIFEADNCTLRLFDGKYLQPVAFINENTGKRRPLLPGEGFSGAVFAEGKSKLILDLNQHPEYLDRFETTQCVLCVPIMSDNEKLGTISIEKTISHFYRKDDLEILEAMASQIALAVTKVRLISRLQEEKRKVQKIQEQLEWDLRMGRNVQEQIISRNIAPWNCLYFSAFYQPMVEVSGDFFQVWRSREHVTIFLADVSGHGVPAALITMTLHHQFMNCMDRGLGLMETLEEINNHTQPILPEGIYFTAQILRIYADYSFSYVNAGHVKIIQYHHEDHKFSEWDSKGIPLGITVLKREQYEERFGLLKPGDMLLFLTDGMSEQRNKKGEEVGLGRILHWLQEALKENEPQFDCEKIKNTFLDKWRAFVGDTPQGDDLTFLLVGFSPKQREALQIYDRAKKAFIKGQLEQAEKLSQRAHETEPNFTQNLILLSKIAMLKKEYGQTAHFLELYLRNTGDKNPQIHYLLGLAYLRSGHITLAKKVYKKILAMKHDYLRAYLALAQCYLKEGSFPKARRTLENALLVFPQEPKIRNFMKKVEDYASAKL
ncbi:MAG: SpoIIE family protein phosphatase [Leptospiraceae bacterium]|nr:SpoIIE family protein phosphatase [Leptospiraceae bacterium]MDW8305748.1 SpoIIE family protein phosphatase [Leptospiraceae bacterium]